MASNPNLKQAGEDYDLNLFFENSADLLCIAGFDGYFKRVNPAMCKLLGYSEEELKSKPATEFILESDRHRTVEYLKNSSAGTPLLNFENRYVTSNGDIVWLNWTATPVTEKKLFYSIAKNITHNRKLSDDRNRLISNLTRVNDELKHLSFSTTHDLRSPLGNIIGILSILDISEIEDKETVELLSMIEKSALKMKQILDRQIDVLKDSEKSDETTQQVNLSDCLRATTDSIKSYIETSKTSITSDFSAFDSVRFDRTYLESIFLNLITNSIRYAKPNESPSITIKTEIKNGTRQLVFTDNGIGMDMNVVKGKIFGFNQTFHNNKESKGIGLYLVSTNVQAMGGSVSVNSEVGLGTTFTISFAV